MKNEKQLTVSIAIQRSLGPAQPLGADGMRAGSVGWEPSTSIVGAERALWLLTDFSHLAPELAQEGGPAPAPLTEMRQLRLGRVVQVEVARGAEQDADRGDRSTGEQVESIKRPRSAAPSDPLCDCVSLASPFTKQKDFSCPRYRLIVFFDKVIRKSQILDGGACWSWVLSGSQTMLSQFRTGKNRPPKTLFGGGLGSIGFH